ncbi:MAG: ArsR/SmtB family transcription factor [Phycisphaerae bacterium]
MIDVTNPKLMERVAERFRALGDENRIRLLVRLARSSANVRTLTEDLGVSQAATSKHLAILRRAGLVDYKSRGAQSVYHISDPSVNELCNIVCTGVLDYIRDQAAAVAAAPSPVVSAR